MVFLKMLFFLMMLSCLQTKSALILDFECPSVSLTVLFKHKVKNDFQAVYDSSALA